jgi:hypothetical protein
MTDIRRYVTNKTYEELIETQRNSVVGGDVHQAVTLEIQRFQLEKNILQISDLIKEVKNLKEIADKNAVTAEKNGKSSNKIAAAALIISFSALLVQIFLQTPMEYNHRCNYTGTPELKNQTEHCEWYIRVGVHSIFWEDQGYHPIKY